jgi:hypothetical protein
MTKDKEAPATPATTPPAPLTAESPAIIELQALAGVIAIDTAASVQAWATKHQVQLPSARKAPVTVLALAIGMLCEQAAAPDLVLHASDLLLGHALVSGTVAKLPARRSRDRRRGGRR